MKYTYRELIARLRINGCMFADMIVGRMMTIVEEETGEFPDYDEPAPDWVVNQCIGG